MQSFLFDYRSCIKDPSTSTSLSCQTISSNMRFISLLAVAFAPIVLGANFLVTVGEDSLFAFKPEEIHPAAGDTVTFQFLTRNHSATTTMFSGAVCPPPPGGFGTNGFDTGFQPTTATDHPEVTVTIKDTAPHFVSCMQAAGAHCRRGMILAINPTADMTTAQFKANAIAS
ncbi:hypothetical protein D9615_005388 [Tricholomella constricta]|uniref:Extracellular serine-rich protein n=1 Tax=Tricholomella constricta TaxID=117010 RepID=A0A8H5HDK4_9AGAR|nr:hypothetical protein D9615_005388 [Tricholomella constricta]